MSERLSSGSNPSLLLLAYDRDRLAVKNLIVVPKHFFTMGIMTQPPEFRPGNGRVHREEDGRCARAVIR
ncbi:MAG: hypothetical protein CMH94_07420, partial [Oceanicaulis sp.]|nr:hypothetical protein [Oceanicaulis sp.]